MSIFQRSLAARRASVVGGKAAGIKRQLMSISFVNYCQFFPFCGLEECAMHIDNPQMRGLFFCGVTRQICRGCNQPRGTRQVCRGQNRPWDTRRSNAESSTDGGSARDTRECAGRPFSLCDYPNNIRDNGHRKESHPILILCLSYSEIPIKFQ